MELQYIGISEHFATGEGVTYTISSGTKEQITQFFGPYFSIGLEFYTFEAIKEALVECQNMNQDLIIQDQCLRTAYVLKTHLPAVANFIQKHGFGSFSYSFHYNLA